MQVNVLEAKTKFSKLLEAVDLGEDVVIANRGKPVARIVNYEAPKVLRKPGAWAHIVQPRGYDDFTEVNARLMAQLRAGGIFAGASLRESARGVEGKIKAAAIRHKCQ